MKGTRIHGMLSLVLLSILSLYAMHGFGAAVYPSGYRSGMGYNPRPFGQHDYRGGMAPSAVSYGGYMPPPSHGMPMQNGFGRYPFYGPHGTLPYGSPGFPGMGGSHPFDRCNGGNCGYWGGCQGGHCGEFYDFRPCHTPECFDGPIHGFDCIGGYCGRVCNGATCRDFAKQPCPGKSSPEPEDKENAKKET
ncbi:hypothetical protein ECG_07311 [Echinococcus granulosus]|uniref:Expressed conserved protein n=2 Tax=Echinococcus granulosus TaxID=6210 RepID=A0A068WQA6_ECHGR|nr:hypothetical protein ECG_07311 [Echinococcus granulosus]CDS21992.1 expressed conserved protein [Echinococcus granulosus]